MSLLGDEHAVREVRAGGASRPHRRVRAVSWVIAIVVTAELASSCVVPIGLPRPDGFDPVPVGSRGSSVAEEPSRRCVEPAAGSEAERVEPAEVSIDAVRLQQALDYAVAKGSQSVRVYRHGCLVGTGSNDPSVERVPLPAWSMTKGVVSMLVGRAVATGALAVDDPIGAHLPQRDERKAALTVRQFLNQTTGLRLAWSADLNEAATTDSARSVLARPFEAVPGTRFNYAQTTITALIAVVEAAVGEDLQSFAQRELFGRIGISVDQWRWDRDASGRTQGFAFLEMTPRAFARIGRLLLQEGAWEGEQLIPAGYIAQARTGTDANPCYGYLWVNNLGTGCPQTGPTLTWFERPWMPTLPSDSFALSGMFDQLVIVIPSLDMVVVRMGLPHQLLGDPWGDVSGEKPAMTWRFARALMAAVTDVEVADPGEWQPAPPEVVDWVHIFPVPVPEPKW